MYLLNSHISRFLKCCACIYLIVYLFTSTTKAMAEAVAQPAYYFTESNKVSAECIKQWQLRYFLKGPISDWHQYPSCSAITSAWWLPDLSVKKHYVFSVRSLMLENQYSGEFIVFSPDWLFRLHQLIDANDSGPPKWMPPELAYWDVYLGDWRYLHRSASVDITKALEQPDLMMLWVRYDRDGLGFDATFDVGKLLRIVNVMDQNFMRYWSKWASTTADQD